MPELIFSKVKIYDNNVNAKFQGKKVPKENASYTRFLSIMLYSVVKVRKNYYPQTHLEEYKYETKNANMENLINYELEASSSDDETDSDSDNNETVSDNKKDNDESH